MKRPQALIDVILYCVFVGVVSLIFSGFVGLLYFRSIEFSNGCVALFGLFSLTSGILFLVLSYGLAKYAQWAWGAAIFLSNGIKGVDIKGRLQQADVKAAFAIKETDV